VTLFLEGTERPLFDAQGRHGTTEALG
jgi:hypothetical protein